MYPYNMYMSRCVDIYKIYYTPVKSLLITACFSLIFYILCSLGLFFVYILLFRRVTSRRVPAGIHRGLPRGGELTRAKLT